METVFVKLWLKCYKIVTILCNVQYCNAFFNFTMLHYTVYYLKQINTENNLNQLIVFPLFLMVKFLLILKQFFGRNCVWEMRYHYFVWNNYSYRHSIKFFKKYGGREVKKKKRQLSLYRWYRAYKIFWFPL